MMYIYRLAAHI